jgi:hypothetical protein
MVYLLVVLVAAAVGAAAFRATLHQSAAPTAAGRHRETQPVGVPVPGSGVGSGPSSGPSPGRSYAPVTDIRASWESRLTGALGLVIAIIVGAVSLALGTYLGISFLVRLLDRSVG